VQETEDAARAEWRAVVPPGAQIIVIEGPTNATGPFIVRLKFPPDYRLPPHRYPVIEHLTVISGTLNMGTGDKFDPAKTVALQPGSVSILQPRTNHFAWTKEETIVQVHGIGPWVPTYVDPSDDPSMR
jgi:quercetin dioxygenase-like cupin family protein